MKKSLGYGSGKSYGLIRILREYIFIPSHDAKTDGLEGREAGEKAAKMSGLGERVGRRSHHLELRTAGKDGVLDSK